MKKTPLLPRPFPSPFTSEGVAHSIWSCALPNPSFVWMPPLPGATVRTPSATLHGAGALPLSLTHCDRSLPSKSTMASDGGAPGVAPGVTIGGSFDGLGICPGTRSCCATAAPASNTTPAPTVRQSRMNEDDDIREPPAADYM